MVYHFIQGFKTALNKPGLGHLCVACICTVMAEPELEPKSKRKELDPDPELKLFYYHIIVDSRVEKIINFITVLTTKIAFRDGNSSTIHLRLLAPFPPFTFQLLHHHLLTYPCKSEIYIRHLITMPLFFWHILSQRTQLIQQKFFFPRSSLT